MTPEEQAAIVASQQALFAVFVADVVPILAVLLAAFTGLFAGRLVRF